MHRRATRDDVDDDAMRWMENNRTRSSTRGGKMRARAIDATRSIDRSIARSPPRIHRAGRRWMEDRTRSTTTTDPNAIVVAHTQGVKAAPAQRAAGYKGSTESGSAPKTYVFARREGERVSRAVSIHGRAVAREGGDKKGRRG